LEAPVGAAAGGEGEVQAWTFNGGEAWCYGGRVDYGYFGVSLGAVLDEF